MASTPSFAGFPKEGIRFLRGLEKNNDREWFQDHKKEYLDYIVAPAQSFIVTFGKRLQRLFPGIHYDTRTNGQGSLNRIYRDIRFTKDKSPYNTHVWLAFWEGPGKKMESPGFGIGFDATGWGIHGGHPQFSKAMLESYRDAVVDRTLGSALEAAVAPLRKGHRYEIGGATFARVPRGYDPDHPRADWLRHDGLWAYRSFRDAAALHRPALVDRCVEVCRELAPLHRWLVKVDRRIRARP